VIGTLAVDEWAVTFGIAQPSTASVPTSYYYAPPVGKGTVSVAFVRPFARLSRT